MKAKEKKIGRRAERTNLTIPSAIKAAAVQLAESRQCKGGLSGLVTALLERELNRGPSLSPGEIQDKLHAAESLLKELKKQHLDAMGQ